MKKAAGKAAKRICGPEFSRMLSRRDAAKRKSRKPAESPFCGILLPDGYCPRELFHSEDLIEA
ncbi:hypothetical protein OBV_12980 [Oscillibacter valericigenes Sjm18-20]|nr:hypothetical protein OBV_12980 [Oscillibacter valericigenes Sjm18-20]